MLESSASGTFRSTVAECAMKQTGISRRDILKLMSLGVGGAALANLWPQSLVLAQDTAAASSVYAEDIALTDAEILRVRAGNLRFAFNIDQAITDYSQVIVYMARRTATGLGITIDVNNAANSASVQATAMSSQVKLDYDGIFTLAVDVNELADAVEEANQAGIPVIVTGGQPPRGQLLAQMNSTNYLGCYQAATALVQSVGSTGQIAVLSSGRDLSIYRDGERGVLQAISESEMQLVDLIAVVDEAGAQASTASLLKAYPDQSAIFCAWGEAVDGALTTINAAGSGARLGGFGAEVDTFRAFADGNPTLVSIAGERASVIGRSVVNVLCKGYLKQSVASEFVVPTVIVDGSNYRDRWVEMYPNLRAPWEGTTATATPAASAS
jgi:ABC-type sugar transport system substrate-binding protein